MLVDKLRTVAPHKLDSEAVKPRNMALKLDAVHQKHRYLDLVIADVREEHVLKS